MKQVVKKVLRKITRVVYGVSTASLIIKDSDVVEKISKEQAITSRKVKETVYRIVSQIRIEGGTEDENKLVRMLLYCSLCKVDWEWLVREKKKKPKKSSRFIDRLVKKML